MSNIIESSTARKSSYTRMKKVKNSQLIEYEIDIESLNKWTIPDVPNKDIYKIGFLDYKSLINIKTLERTTTVDREEQTIQLLGVADVNPYLDKYKYIHVGLIQITFKPLTLSGLNASLLVCLRDSRCLN